MDPPRTAYRRLRIDADRGTLQSRLPHRQHHQHAWRLGEGRLLSFREAHEVGYRYVESFIHYFTDYWDKPAELKKRVDDIGVRFVTISNGGPLEMHFEDPARHDKLIEDHLRLGRFIKHFDCKHLKINLGPRRKEGTTDEDLKQIASVLGKLGAKLRAEGIRLAVHAHMWAQFENRREVDYVMSHTDARDVAFVLDTGHVTMAGMDPVALDEDASATASSSST